MTKFHSIDEFLKDLEQTIEIEVNNEENLPRISQLTQRTNQFNMCTIRLSESEVFDLLKKPGQMFFTAALSDRFGHSGIVGLAHVSSREEGWYIENFLMSCRVLGRGVEQTFLHYIMKKARDREAQTIFARYIASAKNKPFANFYPDNHFELFNKAEKNGEAVYRFSLKNLADSNVSFCSIKEGKGI